MRGATQQLTTGELEVVGVLAVVGFVCALSPLTRIHIARHPPQV